MTSSTPPTPQQSRVRRRRRLRFTRDGILFATGLVGIIYETLVNHGDRSALLVVFGAMVGLPAFIRTDESKKGELPEEKKEEESKT